MWVLLFVAFVSTQGGALALTTQTFTSEAACLDAGKTLGRMTYARTSSRIAADFEFKCVRQ